MGIPQQSSLRDRTPEFLAIAERLQRQLGTSSSSANGSISSKSDLAGASDSKSNGAKSSSEFSKRAADIGHGIHRTSLKLQKLAQLAKRTSMFDDPAMEVDELTGIIKQDIQGLNSSIADLQRVSGRSKEDNKQSTDHSHTVVDNLRLRLKDATLEFKDVLTLRTDNLKHHKERRSLFSSNADPEAALPLLHRHRSATPAASSTPPATSSALSGPPLPPPGGNSFTFNPNSNGGSGSSSSTAAATYQPSFLQAQQQQQLSMAQPADTYLTSRAEALRNVETTIIELGGIFQKLSEMVAEQGELAIRIDENVEDTLGNVTSAQAQLVKYLSTISSNRWLILKVFGVLFAFLVMFMVFIV
ncbi:MAG: hypothetical protein WDW36_009218 [Sanguina aurantia]